MRPSGISFDGEALWQARPPLAEAGAPPLARLMQAPSKRLQGAHGQAWREGHLWTTSTSPRSIYQIEAKSWVVQKIFRTPGNRLHDLAFEGRYLW